MVGLKSKSRTSITRKKKDSKETVSISTDGLDITDLPTNSVQFTAWDFAGQQVRENPTIPPGILQVINQYDPFLTIDILSYTSIFLDQSKCIFGGV
jgi:hypothetical protein